MREHKAHAFIGRRGYLYACRLCPFRERLEYVFTIFPGLVCRNFQSVFYTFCRLLQCCNQIAQLLPLLFSLGCSDDQAHSQESAVVEIIIFP